MATPSRSLAGGPCADPSCPPPHPTAAPWLTQFANAFIRGRLQDPATQAALARDAVDNLERLGPTFVSLAGFRAVGFGECSWGGSC